MLQKLQHSHIVKFFDIHESDEYQIIEMEYVSNGTLRQLIKNLDPSDDESHDEAVAKIMR